MFVLLISKDEEGEIARFPAAIRDHFSGYFQFTSPQFSIAKIHDYVTSTFQKIENLVLAKRRQFFNTEIVSRSVLDQALLSRDEHRVKYDFALSFSGAQRAHARDLANALNGRGCDVFFDEFETPTIVGKNLADELYYIYSAKSRYCVILVSEAYKAGPWTNQERRAALDKAINQADGTYIIPIRIDDVELPGLSNSISYLRWEANTSVLAGILYEKLVTDMVLSQG